MLAGLAESLLEAFHRADTDGDGMLTFAEARGIIHGLTQAQFEALDRNNDGYLTREELKEALAAVSDDYPCGACRHIPSTVADATGPLHFWLPIAASMFLLLSLTRWFA